MTYLFSAARVDDHSHGVASCDPVLKQSKDPDYADAVYDRVLSPGRWRTCNKTEEHQETLFPCKECKKMLPSAKSGCWQWKDRLRRNVSCIDGLAPKKGTNISV